MTRRYSSTAQPTTLSASCTSAATTIQVSATTGFPAVDFILALDYGAAGQELVLVTNVSGTTLTVTRGYNSSAASAHALGAVVRHVHAAIDFTDSRTHEAATSGVHGAAGAVVGTTDSQALSNKDLSSGTNSFPTSLVTLTGTQTLSNKDLSAGTNIFPAALATDAEVATASATAATNLSNHAAATVTHGATGAVVGTTNAQTLTNKSVDLGTNTVTGTTAQFNTALSDNDFATLAGAESLSNKTLVSPVITGINQVTPVTKVSDETRTSNVTLADDAELVFAVPAAGTYIIDLYLYVNSAADSAGDLRCGFTFPTGSLLLGVVGLDATLASGQSGTVNRSAGGVTSGSTFALIGASTGYTEVRIHGVLTATATGNFKLQWAQATSSASATVVKGGSHMLVRRTA